MRKKSMSFKLFKEWFSKRLNGVPFSKLPENRPDLDSFLNDSSELKVIWFGHSTFILNIEGVIILVDPVFGKSAAPFDFMVKRFQPPVLKLNDLPKVDIVLISHDHYDHLEMKSIKYFKEKDVIFVAPLGVGSYLKGWGIDSKKIMEKDWWESVVIGKVELIATPSQHFSGRDGIHNNETLWASWVLKSKNHSVFFSGDSVFDSHFKDIGVKYGPFDVTFLENGQYNKNWKYVHLFPIETIQAFKDLRGKKLFPVHWGMFELSLHSWFEPIEKIAKLAKENNIDLLAPEIGKVVKIKERNELIYWWDAVERQTN
jgi:L-ascorbate metabolism protein UlaG (beta-lactamase superfamily)